jgi:very-short-patch-repair endonuclease
VSVEEKELKEYVESLGLKVDHYDRDFLGPYGADIVIEDKKVIIEYDGIYWHSELYKDSGYHLEKKLLAEDKGYTLIHVFSDEWVYKRDIVKSRIRHILGCPGATRLYPRKCQIRQVEPREYREFLDRNHIQGSVNSRWAYGLYSGDRLVSLMTFGMSRYEENTVELLRFCSDMDFVIPGAAGKLFNHFIKSQLDISEIVSYADMRWSSGNAFYTKLGFELEAMSEPGYFIVDGDVRRNRMNYQRHRIAGPDDEGKTEHEITLERGLYRIYDCGQLKYKWTRK